MKSLARLFPTSLDETFEDMFGGLLTRPFPGLGLGVHFETIEEPGKVIVRAEVPGLTEDDISIDVKNNVITVKGESKQKKEEDKIFRSSYRSFSRSWTLPDNALVDGIEADLKSGILAVTIPMDDDPDPVKPKKITVNCKD